MLSMFTIAHTAMAHSPYAWVDYLIWNMREDALSYAGVLPAGIPNDTTKPYSAYTAEQDPKWQSGVRIGAGFTFRENWDTSLAWTHFSGKSCSSVADTNTKNTIVAVPLAGFNGAPVFFATSAQALWKLRAYL